jgi:protein-disulfide isomerase
MTTQPEALRLADKMNSYSLRSGYAWHCHKAAAELRRLHEVNTELLAALKALVEADAPDYIKSSIWKKALAAINKAEGELK